MTSKEPAQDRKEQILTAATRLLVTKGLQFLSFETVANEAGLSRQLVRYYFNDLDALMLDLWTHMAMAYQDTLVAGVVKVGQVERLGFFLDFFFGVSEEHPMPENLEAYDAMFAYSLACPELKERMRAQYKALGQVMLHELAIAHPDLTNSDCEQLSFLFVSAMHAHWSFVATLGYSRSHNRLARDAFERVIASYVEGTTVTSLEGQVWQATE